MLFLINAMLFQSLFISKHVQVSSKDQEPNALLYLASLEYWYSYKKLVADLQQSVLK